MRKLPPLLARQLAENRSRRTVPVSQAVAQNRMPPPPRHGEASVFEVDPWTDRLGALAERFQRQLVWLGNLETRLFADELGPAIDRPIYITGLARAGTTVLLEALERHPDTATHRYRDFPLVLTPMLWSRLLDRVPRRSAPPRERAHRDGITVTPESPEAFEEVVWMTFFPGLHGVGSEDFLDGRTSCPAFERFYSDHIRKLMWLRGGTRYLSKANYNVSRLEYLLKMFPDARFVIPVRDPVWHVASLMKQHRLFCAGQHQDSRASRHLRRAGHFEFGLERRPISADDPATALAIDRMWTDGQEVDGWARYWNHIYGFVRRRLDANQRLRDAALVVRWEDLCRAPHQTVDRILDHCRLSASRDFVDALAGRFRAPSYYAPSFSDAELEIIAACTAETARRFGYGEGTGRWRAAS